MRNLWFLLMAVAALINLAPVLGVFSTARMTGLYGVDLGDPNLEILMRHRAVLFGLVGGLLLAAVIRPALRAIGYLVGFVSMISFLLIAWVVGDYSGQIERVMLVDGVGIGALAGAAGVDFFRLRDPAG